MLCCAVLTMLCCAVLYRRRNFDRHFQEWRHAHGMRCLGIPNTKHFHDITLIQVLNIYSLWQRKAQKTAMVVSRCE